jgi:hypothetical protein
MIKSLLISLAAASALSGVASPVLAAPHGIVSGRAVAWTPINHQEAQIQRRIDIGMRTHALTRVEAEHLRADYRRIVRLEARYRRDGLTRWEVADLDRRLDALDRQIGDARRHDPRR